MGIDIMSDYNPVEMKEWRLEQIKKESEKHPDSSWTFIKGDIADSYLIQDVVFQTIAHDRAARNDADEIALVVDHRHEVLVGGLEHKLLHIGRDGDG